jgi:WD40 repeat protein
MLVFTPGLWVGAAALCGCQPATPVPVQDAPRSGARPAQAPIVPVARLLDGSGEGSLINAIAISPDGARVATGGNFNRTIRTWDVASGRPLRVIPGFDGSLLMLTFSPDGTRIASAAMSQEFLYPVQKGRFENLVQLWEAETGRDLGRLQERGRFPMHLAFRADGTRLLKVDRSYSVQMWDLTTRARVANLDGGAVQGEATFVSHACSDAAARWIASVNDLPDPAPSGRASTKNRLQVWDLEAGRIRVLREYEPEHIVTIGLSADGRRLASLSGPEDRQLLELWDVATGTVLARTTLEATDRLSILGLTPEGTRIVAGAEDGTMTVWDGRGRRPLLSARAPAEPIQAVVFLPEDRLRVAGGGRNIVTPPAPRVPGDRRWPAVEPIQVWDVELPPVPGGL